MTGKKVHLGLFITIIIALLVIAGCGTQEMPDVPDSPDDVTLESIKIGVPYPMTGDYAGDGEEMIDGVTLAVEQINANGGVLGRPVEILTADIKGLTPEDVTAGFDYLAARDVDFFVSGYAGEPADIYAAGKYDIPYFHFDTATEAVKPVQENYEEYWNVMQLIVPEEYYGPYIAEVMNNRIPDLFGYQYRDKTQAVLSLEWMYNIFIAEPYMEYMENYGWETVYYSEHPFGHTEFAPELMHIRNEDPDIIFFSTLEPPGGVAFMNQFVTDPVESLVYIQYVPSVPEFFDLLGDNANDILWCTAINYLPSDDGLEFVQTFEERFGKKPGFSIAAAVYDAVNIWADAVENVGDSAKYKEITDHVKNNTYQGICGNYVWDHDGKYCKAGDDFIPMHFFQIQEGEQVLLFLGSEKLNDFKTPFWVD